MAFIWVPIKFKQLFINIRCASESLFLEAGLVKEIYQVLDVFLLQRRFLFAPLCKFSNSAACISIL